MKTLDRYLQRWRISKVSPYISAGASVLDIGSADGVLPLLVPQLGRYTGIDPDVEQSHTDGKVTMLHGLFPQALPDKTKFDVITMLAVLEHIPVEMQAELAANCAEYLNPGGWLLITAPTPTVDHILTVLKFLRLIDGMSLEQHYGFDPRTTPSIFAPPHFSLHRQQRFQLGVNCFFAFKRN